MNKVRWYLMKTIFVNRNIKNSKNMKNEVNNSERTNEEVITFEMEIFQGYTCMGCAVVNDLEVEETFSPEELSKMRYLVSQLDEELYSEGIMPVLRDGAPELYERMLSKVRSAIFDFLVEDGISQGYIDFEEEDLRRNFLKDYGLDDEDFDEDLYYEWYDEEMARIRCSGLRWIRARYPVDDQVSMEELPEYTVDIPVAFLK